MKYGTKVRVMKSKRVLPMFWGAKGKYMWSWLDGLIGFVMFDEPIEDAPQTGYGSRFHSIALDALEVIDV